MAKTSKKQLTKMANKGLQALQTLSVQFVTYLIEEGAKGKAIDKVVTSFTRNQAKIISSILGGAGLATGAWAAISIWTSSLGLWGSFGYALGLVSMPVWVPFVGGAAGLTAAGGAIYGVLNFAKGRQQTRKVRGIIGFSKVLLDREKLEAQDERVLSRFLRARKIKKDEIEKLLSTSSDEAQQLVLRHLSIEERLEIARYIFPLVYNHDGAIGDADRRRFARVCSGLQLKADAAREISQAYRQRLDDQWDYMRQLVDLINHFAVRLTFDGREMELVREQLNQLMRFDPRRTAVTRRERLLAKLGRNAPNPPMQLSDPAAEAALMGAYAMAHTAVPHIEDRTILERAFDELLDGQDLAADSVKSLIATRKKVDKLYAATREQILAAEEADRQERRAKKKSSKRPKG
jgi:exonuclease VII small subunit